MVLGWGTWNIGWRVIRRKMRGKAKKGVVVGMGLLLVAIAGAFIASRNDAS